MHQNLLICVVRIIDVLSNPFLPPDENSETNEGPYYTQLGAAPDIPGIRALMEQRWAYTVIYVLLKLKTYLFDCVSLLPSFEGNLFKLTPKHNKTLIFKGSIALFCFLQEFSLNYDKQLSNVILSQGTLWVFYK